jgi:hypothetical protein
MALPINKPQAKPTETDKTLPLGDQITYLPGEGDPLSVKWHGFVFHANVPKSVTKPELIEQARGNKFFRVGSFDTAKDSTAAPDAAIMDPKTSGEYRAHFVGWFKKVTDINVLVTTWAKEQPMREACEVGADDYSYIGTLFHPKMHELAKAAGLSEGQLAELWARYGVFQLPF